MLRLSFAGVSTPPMRLAHAWSKRWDSMRARTVSTACRNGCGQFARSMGAGGAIGRGDCGDRATAYALAQEQRGKPSNRRNSRRGRAERDCFGGGHGRPRGFQIRARIRGLARARPSSYGHGGPRTGARHQQTGRYVPSHLADPRRALGAQQFQGATALVDEIGRAAACERSHRGAGQQDGTDDLGVIGA